MLGKKNNMSTWTKQKLGDVVDLQQGLCINRKSRHLLCESSELPLLRITDLINGKQEQYINANLVSPQFIADKESLIYTRTGQVGLVFKNKRGVVHNNCFKILPKKELSKDFLYYVLKQKSFHKNIIQIASKAAQPDLTHTAFNSMSVDVPADLPTQTRIASILATYDDLIENNEKRIKILEEMAQRLYTEWFVHFRFHRHEKVKMVESGTKYGMIPEGWEIVKLKNVCERIQAGGTPSRSNSAFWENGTISWYTTGELQDNFLFDSVENISLEAKEKSTAKIFQPGTILMAIYGSPTVGRLGRVTRISSCNQAAVGVVPDTKKLGINYLWYQLLGLREYFNLIATGAAQQNISKEKVEEEKIVFADQELISLFEMKVKNSWDLIEKISAENINLSKTRDLLIPQLVTGRRELK